MRDNDRSLKLPWFQRMRSALIIPLLAVSLGADEPESGCKFFNSQAEQERRICNIYIKWGAKDCSLEEQLRVRQSMSSSALAEIAGIMGVAAGAAFPTFDWKGQRGPTQRPVCPTCNGNKLHGDGSEREPCPTCRGKTTLPSGKTCGWCNGEGTQPKACETCKGSGEGE